MRELYALKGARAVPGRGGNGNISSLFDYHPKQAFNLSVSTRGQDAYGFIEMKGGIFKVGIDNGELQAMTEPKIPIFKSTSQTRIQ